MTQRFQENSVNEATVIGLALPSLETLGTDHDTLFAEAFACYLLGDVLYDLGRDPLADVITRPVYRTAFPAIHDLFTRPGTFEFYLEVFRKIFTDDVDVEFVIPGPGQLEINVSSLTLEESYIMARQIVDDAYVYHRVVTSDLNEPIMAVGVKGIKTQKEIDGLIVEISAHGVFTTANLVTPP